MSDQNIGLKLDIAGSVCRILKDVVEVVDLFG